MKASVVEMLCLGPVGDPILFLWLLGLKTQIELIAFSPANLHPLVLRHHPVIDGPFKESKLDGRREEKKGGRGVREYAFKLQGNLGSCVTAEEGDFGF